MKKKTPTKLDFAIMGLLREAVLSGYQIRQIFETSDMGNYSSSPGSIYPALKRLERLGLLQLRNEEDAKGKIKKRFALTTNGKATLLEWLQQKVSKEDVYKRMDEQLLKFAFMDQLISKEKQIQFLQQIAEILPVKINELKQFQQDFAQYIPFNASLAVQHGIRIFQAHYDWVLEAIKSIQTSTT